MRHLPFAFALRSLAIVAMPLLTGATAQAQKLPSDLDAVPRQAAGFLHVRAADLYQSEPFADLRGLVNRAGAEAMKIFERKSPIEPATIDRVTLLFLTLKEMGNAFPHVDPEATSAIVILRVSKPFDRLRVLEAMGERDKLYRRSLYHFHEELWSGMLLLDERTILIGAEDSIVQYLDMMRTSDANGPLQSALATAAAGQHHLVLGVNPAAVGKAAEFTPPELAGMFQARCGAATLHVSKELRFELRLDYDKADQAAEGEKAVRALIDLMRKGLDFGIVQLEGLLQKDADKVDISKVPESFVYLLGLGYLREMDHLLDKAPIQRDATSVRMPLVYNRPEVASLNMLSLMAIAALGESRSVTFSTVGQAIDDGNENPQEKHLKTLYQALEKYHAEKGSYPPAVLRDAEGRPTSSWRVALLPYLGDEAKALHSQFRQDEPWDSLHNKRLIKRMPPAFQAINGYYGGKNWRAADLAFVGPGAAFDAKLGRKKAELRPDAALLVHTMNQANAIYWSKPADLTYTVGKPLPRLFEENSFGESQVTVLLANGKFRVIKSDIDEKDLRQLIEGKK